MLYCSEQRDDTKKETNKKTKYQSDFIHSDYNVKNNIDSVIEITVNLSSPSSKIVQKTLDSPSSFKEETNKKSEYSLYDTKSFNHENKSKTKSLFFESSFQIFKDNSLNELEKKSTIKKISLQNSKETIFRDISSNFQKKHSKNELYDKGNSKSLNFNNNEKLMLVQKDLTLIGKNSPSQYFQDNKKKKNNMIDPTVSLKYSLSNSIPDIKDFYNDINGNRSPFKRNNQSKIKNGKVNLVYNLQNKISYHMMSSLDHKYNENHTRINKLEGDFISEELSEGLNLENHLDLNNRNELNVRVVSDKLEKEFIRESKNFALFDYNLNERNSHFSKKISSDNNNKYSKKIKFDNEKPPTNNICTII